MQIAWGLREEEEGSLWKGGDRVKVGEGYKKRERAERTIHGAWRRWKMHCTYDRWRPLDTRYSKGHHQHTGRDELTAFGGAMWPHATQNSNAQSLAAPTSGRHPVVGRMRLWSWWYIAQTIKRRVIWFHLYKCYLFLFLRIINAEISTVCSDTQPRSQEPH